MSNKKWVQPDALAHSTRSKLALDRLSCHSGKAIDAQREREGQRTIVNGIIGALLLTAALGASVVGCSGDSDDSANNSTQGASRPDATTSPVDQSELLNSLEDVRAMIVAAASDVNPANIEDVEFESGKLSVTISDVSDLSSDREELRKHCEEISSAIALPDLRITLETAEGIVLAECAFRS